MDYLKIVNDYLNKDLEELKEIQRTHFYSVRECLLLISKQSDMDLDINKMFLLLCFAPISSDKEVDEQEFELLRQFVNSNITLKDAQDYYLDLVENDRVFNFNKEISNTIKKISDIAFEEYIGFNICFLVANKDFNELKENYIKELVGD